MIERLPRIVVSVCLIGEDGVLLVERAREPFKGRFSLPGGRVEFGETLADAARREVEEETGLGLPSVEFHTLHETIDERFHTVIAVHRADLPHGAAPVAGDDAASVRFVPLASLRAMERDERVTPGLASIVEGVRAALGPSRLAAEA